ncbi:hypothetical protein PIB30_094190 [Stylosanthes scabra]|uniref:Protein phosphatase n=1 Tax=Stylosanthes scabra TaxID=79078 RepID=A0ABU6XUP1_9FABA|nr:hypothetical protein [Stylosanthes scabra]
MHNLVLGELCQRRRRLVPPTSPSLPIILSPVPSLKPSHTPAVLPPCATLSRRIGISPPPLPDKEETGGEDAHFICKEEQAIGVADGVGGWADLGVNAGLFA